MGSPKIKPTQPDIWPHAVRPSLFQLLDGHGEYFLCLCL